MMAILMATCLLPVNPRELLFLDYLVIPLFLTGAGLAYATISLLLSYQVNTRIWWR